MIRCAIKEGAALIGLGFELLFLLAQEKLRASDEPTPLKDATLIEKPVVRISPEAEAMLASSNRAAKMNLAVDAPLEGSIEARRSPMHLG